MARWPWWDGTCPPASPSRTGCTSDGQGPCNMPSKSASFPHSLSSIVLVGSSPRSCWSCTCHRRIWWCHSPTCACEVPSLCTCTTCSCRAGWTGLSPTVQIRSRQCLWLVGTGCMLQKASFLHGRRPSRFLLHEGSWAATAGLPLHLFEKAIGERAEVWEHRACSAPCWLPLHQMSCPPSSPRWGQAILPARSYPGLSELSWHMLGSGAPACGRSSIWAASSCCPGTRSSPEVWWGTHLVPLFHPAATWPLQTSHRRWMAVGRLHARPKNGFGQRCPSKAACPPTCRCDGWAPPSCLEPKGAYHKGRQCHDHDIEATWTGFRSEKVKRCLTCHEMPSNMVCEGYSLESS